MTYKICYTKGENTVTDEFCCCPEELTCVEKELERNGYTIEVKEMIPDD